MKNSFEDSSPIEHGHSVPKFLSLGINARFRVQGLPSYTPFSRNYFRIPPEETYVQVFRVQVVCAHKLWLLYLFGHLSYLQELYIGMG